MKEHKLGMKIQNNVGVLIFSGKGSLTYLQSATNEVRKISWSNFAKECSRCREDPMAISWRKKCR